MDGIDVRGRGQFYQVGLKRQDQHVGDHRLVQRRVLVAVNGLGQVGIEGRNQPFIDGDRGTSLNLLHHFLDHIDCQPLARFPSIEAVRVMAHQECQVVTIVGILKLDRRREAAQQRRYRCFIQTTKDEFLLWPGDIQHGRKSLPRFIDAGNIKINHRKADVLPFTVQQTDLQRQMVGILDLLTRRRRAGLFHFKGQGPSGLIIPAGAVQHRSASLAIPDPELGQVNLVGIFHGFNKVLCRHCLAVMAVEIQVSARPESFRPKQGADHADHLGAFFVHRSRVEVIDFDE